ncbi:fimbrial biogenesis chaperone [Citrobacter sp. FP75]|uniref:fimbrial biogenesis chaperone n=1 Tax=Citrobacter sp. FP75 TaxID=1852949 RepID=UPI001BC9B638|nr:molecular chaperone [Citrobacter sp. FP75]
MTLRKGLPIVLLALSLTSHAAIQPDRTRIIFNGNEKASSLKIENQSKQLPYLAYSWIENEKGNKDDTFLVALPPIQRLNPSAISQVRIVKQDKARSLPQDRESLFYFNIREIPPAPENKGSNAIVQMALQSRLKLFWRPAALKKKPGAEVEHQLKINQQGNTLQVNNPTAYYITLAFFGKDDKSQLSGFNSEMINPFSSTTLNAGSYHGNTYVLGYMDDYGGLRLLNVKCHGQCDLIVPEAKK